MGQVGGGVGAPNCSNVARPGLTRVQLRLRGSSFTGLANWGAARGEGAEGPATGRPGSSSERQVLEFMRTRGESLVGDWGGEASKVRGGGIVVVVAGGEGKCPNERDDRRWEEKSEGGGDK
jgi:hypothetical protein